MARLRFDAVKGALDAALDTGTTTISSPGLARLGTVASPNVALICLYGVDPNGNITSSENVYVTAHTAGSTFATITRAGDGTTAGQWVVGSQWTHGFGVADVTDILAQGGAVSSVNSKTGAVVLTYTDVGADVSGAASTVQAASLQKASNLSDVASTATARTNLGLGTAATQASTAFDAAGAAAAVLSTSAQKANNLSDLASTPTARTNLGLGSSAITSSSVLNVLDYGVVNDAYLGAGGSLSSSTWTDSTGPFTSASVGKSFWVEDGSGVWFRTTIATYISSTQVTITATPATVDFQGVYIFGTDNSTALTSLWSTATTLANSGQAKPVYFPAGGYLFNTGILSRTTLAQSAIQILGGGLQQTTFYPINVSGTPGACVTTSMTDTAYWYSGPVNISTPKIAPVLDFAINGNLTGTGDIGIDHGPGIGGIYRAYVANFDQVPDTTYPTSGNAGGRGWRIRNLIVSGTTRYTEQTKFLAGCGVDKCFVGIEFDASTGTNSFEGTVFEDIQVRITEPGARAFMVRGSGTVSALLYHSTINANGTVGPGCSSEAGTFFRSKMALTSSNNLRLAVSTSSGGTSYTNYQQFSLALSSNTTVAISAGASIVIGGVYFTSPAYQAAGSSSINLIAPNASGTVSASTDVTLSYGLSGCPAIIGTTSGSVSGTVTSLPTSAGTNWRVQDGQIVNLVSPTTISATTTSSSNIVTLASGNTATVWQGCSVLIPGAGPSGGPLLTNVTKVLSSTTFQVATAATTAASAASGTVNVQQAFMVYGNVASGATSLTTYSVTASATFASGSFVELPPVGIVVGTPRPGVSNTTTDASRLVGSIVNWQVENSSSQATSILAYVAPFATMQYSGWVGSYLNNYPIVQAYGTFQTTAGTLAAGATAGLTNASSGIGIKGNATTPYDVFIPGGTASGAPSSGTHSLFEIVPDATGRIWICTAAGTPGTWVSVAPAQVQTVTVTASGSYAGTVPSWATTAEVRMVGGGGGGGGILSVTGFGGGGGGAAGTVVAKTLSVTGGGAYSGSVGAGGGGGAVSTSGTSGSSTTFIHNSTTYTATGGQAGNAGSTAASAGGIYGLASASTSAPSTGSGAPSSTVTTNQGPGPVPYGCSGGAAGYPQSGSVGGKGGDGGSSTGGSKNNGVNSTTSGTAGGNGESSSSTSPGGGGGGGGGGAFTGGTAGIGGNGGTGSVTIIFRAA